MALQGTLDTFALPDVLRLLAATSKTGRLQIEGDRGAGEVWLDGGNVVGGAVAARTRDTSDVVFELLRHEQGAFEFVAGDRPDGHDPVDVDEVIHTAEARLADWRVVESTVPSLACWVALVDDLPRDDVSISRDRWHTLVAIGEGRTVADLDTRLDLGEIDVSKAVKDLADDGLVVVGEPPATLELEPAPVADAESAPIDASSDGEPSFDEGGSFGIEIGTGSARDQLAAQLASFGDTGLDDADPDQARHGELPHEEPAGGAIVLDLADGDDGHVADVEALPDDAAPADLDEAVRAEIDIEGPHAEAGDDLGGSWDVDLDAALDASAADHSYLGGAGVDVGELEGLPGSAVMPEPLPATDEAEPIVAQSVADTDLGTDPFVRPAAPAGIEAAPAGDDESAEVSRHLAQLSPKAARAIAAAAAGSTDDQPTDAPTKKGKGGKPEEPMNRNLLMKFISSK